MSEDLTAASLREKIAAGELPRDFVLSAARGFLPFEQEELISILSLLAANEDAEVAQTARQSLVEMPPRLLVAYIQGDLSSPEQLDALAVSSRDTAILEALLRSRRTLDSTFEKLARAVEPVLQDIVVTNQERILRAPAILEALLENPRLSADVRRRAQEVHEEFFQKRPAVIAAAVEIEEDESAIADLLEKAAVEPEPAGPTLDADIDDEDPENRSALYRIMKMNAAQRVKLAFKGNKTERTLLIRDRNRIVCTAVLRSPKITESEIEAIAAMRNVDEEILRMIGMRREWTTKYPIVLNLIRNSRAPLGVVLPLVTRLNLRDLKNLVSDKNVGEGVRVMARKLYNARKPG